MGKKLRRFLFVIVSLATVLGIAYSIWNHLAQMEFNGTVAELRAAGYITTLRELAPEAPPAAENGAPFFRAAFALVEGLYPGVLNEPADLADLDIAADLVDRGAERPRCVFDLRYEQGWLMDVPHVLSAGRSAQLFALRASRRADAGDLEGALTDLRRAVACVEALREEPLLISQVSRSMAVRRALEVLETVLPRAPDAGAAVDRLRLPDLEGSWRRALRGDLACVTSMPLSPEGMIASGGGAFAWGWRPAPYMKTDTVRLLRFLRREIESASAEELGRIEAEATSAGVVCRMVMPSVTRVAANEADTMARIRLAHEAARWLDHRRDQGAYPDPSPGFRAETTAEGVVLRAGDAEWRLP